MVALTDEGEPTPVPAVEPMTDDEERRQREAQLRRDNRLRERDEIKRGRGD
jgi:acyl-CoA hydrolase